MEPDNSISSIRVSPASISLEKNHSTTIYAETIFQDGSSSSSDLLWSTSSSAVRISRISADTSEIEITADTTSDEIILITATSIDNPYVKTSVYVQVYEEGQIPGKKIQSIIPSSSSLAIGEGMKRQIDVFYLLEGTSDTGITWSKNNENINISGDSNSVSITGLAVGESTITATSSVNPDIKTNIKVKVLSAEDLEKPSYIKMSSSTIDLDNGTSEGLVATVFKINGSEGDFSLTWSVDSSNIKLQEIRENEVLISDLKPGYAKVRASLTDDPSISSTTTVRVYDENIDPAETLQALIPSSSAFSMSIGEKREISISYLPESTMDRSLIWFSSNDNVEINEADSSANITALKEGSSTITVQSSFDNSIKSEIEIKIVDPDDVKRKVASIEFESPSFEINPPYLQGEFGIRATSKDSSGNIIEDSYDWIVNDMSNVLSTKKPSISSPSEYIIAIGSPGTATITATADGGKKASCNITVGTDNDGILKYSFNDGSKKATIVGYEEAGITGNGGKVTIPAEYMGYEVTEIASKTFADCTALTELTIEGSVDIGAWAFKNCTELGSVNLGEKVTAIRNGAFEGCSSLNLSKIEIPDSVTSIGSGAFRNCSNLTEVTIGSGIVYAAGANSDAFLYCPITSFDCNSPAAEFDIRFTADVYEKMYTPADLVIEDFYTSIEDYAFDGHEEKLISVVIEATKKDDKWKGVKEIGNIAFANCSNLTRVVIPDSVTSDIYTNMFRGCNNLKYVTIGENVPYIDSNTFDGFPIVDFNCTSSAGENVLITFKKEAYEALGEPAELVMENFYTSIASSALKENTNLKEITISSNITEIPWYTFDNCTNLDSVIMDGAKITKIGQYAFRNTKISKIEIPETVTTIENNAFTGTQISILDIPDSVTTLGAYAFSHCPNLTTVTIGSGIGSLENNPFLECGGITSYTIRRETPPTLGPEGLPGTSLKIYVPSSAVDTYKAAEGWSGYNILAIE